MDKATGGYKGWKEVKFFDGKSPDGRMQGREGYRNIVNGQEYQPAGGWNADPPHPTGDLSNCRHSSELYRQNYDRIFGAKNYGTEAAEA